MRVFLTNHQVPAYFVGTLAISWGGFVLAGGSGLLAGTSWQTDPRFMVAVSAMLAGPPVAGILLTGLVSGRGGLRGLLTRLLRWRVGGRWYAVAILTAPIIEMAVLLALSQISPVFLPAIITADNKAALLMAGIAIGLAGGLVEELGWTGFAVPRLKARYGVLGTGLIVGPVWGMWHLLQMWWVGSTSSDALPLSIYLPVFFLSSVAILTAYRVLMVWVYDRTGSLLVAILMHASYIFSTLFVLAPPTIGVPFLAYSGVFAGTLWAVVAAVAMANGWRLSRETFKTPTAFITRHPVLTYFALAFALSWGALLTVVGPGGFNGTTAPTNAQLPFVFLAMFAGPTVAGTLLTGLVDGTAGFRELQSRLLRWRVAARWYAVAVLAAPLLMIATLFTLSLRNPVFLPGIFVSEGRASLLLTSIVAGLVTGFCEELGWTGFAMPRLRLRGGVVATGLCVGVLWGAWHFPLFSSGDPSGAVPSVLFLPGLLFTVLPAFRVLMVWVYDSTGSLLVVMLMHASFTASTLILQPPAIAGGPALIYNLVLATLLCLVIAAVAVANGWHPSRRPFQTGAASSARDRPRA